MADALQNVQTGPPGMWGQQIPLRCLESLDTFLPRLLPIPLYPPPHHFQGLSLPQFLLSLVPAFSHRLKEEREERREEGEEERRRGEGKGRRREVREEKTERREVGEGIEGREVGEERGDGEVGGEGGGKKKKERMGRAEQRKGVGVKK